MPLDWDTDPVAQALGSWPCLPARLAAREQKHGFRVGSSLLDTQLDVVQERLGLPWKEGHSN